MTVYHAHLTFEYDGDNVDDIRDYIEYWLGGGKEMSMLTVDEIEEVN